MKKGTKFISLALAMFMMFALLSGCKKETPEPTKEVVTIRLNEVVRSIFYAPMYAAINQGFFKEQGIEIDLTTGQGADKTMQQVISGNADIGFCGPEQVIYLYNQKQENYAVIFAQLTKRDGSFLVGRTEEKNFKWESLKGKTIIGARPGGVPEMSLEYVIKQAGLNPTKDLELITNLAFTATASAFVSGTGDYVALFEPTASMLQKDKTGYVVSSVGRYSGEMPYTCFFATQEYIKKNPEIIQRMTDAIYKGMLWVQSHSSKEVAQAVASFFPGSDMEVLEMVMDRYKAEDAWAKTPVVDEVGLNRLQDLIQDYNKELIAKRPPYSDIVTTKFAEQALKNVK